MAHIFGPSTREAEAGASLEFEASLVCRAGFRMAGATQRRSQKTKQSKGCIEGQDGCAVNKCTELDPFMVEGENDSLGLSSDLHIVHE